MEEVSHEVDEEWLAAARNHLDALLDAAAGPAYPQTPSASCANCDFLRFCDAGRAHVAGGY